MVGGREGVAERASGCEGGVQQPHRLRLWRPSMYTPGAKSRPMHPTYARARGLGDRGGVEGVAGRVGDSGGRSLY